eukprot:NODE_2719_length_1135_cov_27.905157_g2497_i0.p1 GENE.NODE_2719_length_1135_cov_27.905157_g2497_i0~~NODE_2719_length_1135_cov_27.905157_g2497_i0.p1  ORF type:complete len:195 (+),score=26.20 NODE_2719_length_1135_cov_27.905157_g2497_i0:201-785(+)
MNPEATVERAKLLAARKRAEAALPEKRRAAPSTLAQEIAAVREEAAQECAQARSDNPRLAFLSDEKAAEVRRASTLRTKMEPLQKRIEVQRLISQLPQLVNMIDSYFVISRHIRSMEWISLVGHLHSVHPKRSALTPGDVHRQLEFLVDKFPEWFQKTTLDGAGLGAVRAEHCFQISPAFDHRDVLEAIQNLQM